MIFYWGTWWMKKWLARSQDAVLPVKYVGILLIRSALAVKKKIK